jgi:hypothetical protein
VTVGGVTIGMDVEESGILAHIAVQKDAVVPVGAEIGIVTNNKESYMTFFEKLRIQMMDEQKANEFSEDYESKHQKPSAIVLLKVLKNLIRENKIPAGSGFNFSSPS